jgi:hypothetical protein
MMRELVDRFMRAIQNRDSQEVRRLWIFKLPHAGTHQQLEFELSRWADMHRNDPSLAGAIAWHDQRIKKQAEDAAAEKASRFRTTTATSWNTFPQSRKTYWEQQRLT